MTAKSVLSKIFATFAISLTVVHPVWAGQYIDPNTGGMLFQMLAVAFGIISGFLLLFYSQIKMLLARFARFVREKRSGKQKMAGKQ